MSETAPTVLDASAVLTWFDAEPGYRKVASLMRDLQEGRSRVLIHRLTLMEIYARVLRQGIAAREARQQLLALERIGVRVIEPEAEQLMEAAELRAFFDLPLLDAVVAQCAQSNGAAVLTADPDFRKVASKIRISWVR